MENKGKESLAQTCQWEVVDESELHLRQVQANLDAMYLNLNTLLKMKYPDAPEVIFGYRYSIQGQ
jgi:hypothetical protein